MVKVKKNKLANSLEKVKHQYKEFSFTVGMLKVHFLIKEKKSSEY